MRHAVRNIGDAIAAAFANLDLHDARRHRVPALGAPSDAED